MIAKKSNHARGISVLIFTIALCGVARAANVLEFSTQPSNAVAGGSISPSIVVRIKDSGTGNTVTGASASITLAILANPGGGVLSGTATVNTVNGVATFPNMSINKAGNGYTLSASATGFTAVTSGTFNITPATASRIIFQTQPTNTLSNAAIATLNVAIVDNYDNVVTSANDTIVLSLEANPGSTTLGGTTSKSTTNGIATFNDITVGVIGADYSLRATSNNFGFAISDPFDVAHNLEFTVQPTNAVAGVNINPAVRVTIKDGLGVVVPANNIQIKLTLKTNPGNGTLSGVTTVLATDGVADFAGLNINKAANGYSLQATATSTFGATSGTFNISPAAASKLAFTVQPVSTIIGTNLANITVAVTDAFDNTVPTATNLITLAIRSNPSNGVLSGTTSVNAVAGSAVFSGLSIDKAGNGYTLAATANGLLEKVSSAFNITYKLGFIVQPSDVIAGVAIVPPVQVAIQDAQGNTIVTAAGNITVTVNTGPSGGATSGTITVPAANGVAVFSDLKLNKVGTYTLKATSTSIVTGISDSFDVSPAAPKKLVFITQPTSTTVAAAKHATTIKVEIRDQFDNLVPTATNAVTLSILDTTNTIGATISGTTTVDAVDGVASFDNIFISLPQIGFKLVAKSPGLDDGTSTAFNIKYLLAFVQQPQDNPTCDGLVSCTIAITDANGVTVTQLTGETITLSFAANPGNARMDYPYDNPIFDNVLSITETSVNGVITFNGVFINIGADNYKFKATGPNQSGTCTSNEFDITGCYYSLKFVQQPLSTLVNLPFSPPVKVAVVDLANKVVTSASGSVTLSFKVDASSGGNAKFNGVASAVTATLVAGVATFDGLSIDQAGIDYVLTATSGLHIPADSSKFSIRYKLAFTEHPTNTVAGQVIKPANPANNITVKVFDGLDVPVTTVNPDITISMGAGSATIFGTKVRTATSGVAEFDDLVIQKAGTGYKFRAASTNLYVAGLSNAFNILTDVASKIVITTQPKSAVLNATMAAVKVTVQDQYSNVVTSPALNVSLALANNPTGATLNGTTTVATVNGVATFSNLSMNRAGVGFTMTATCSNFPQLTTSAFNITYNMTVVGQPSNTTSMLPITPGVQVTIEDAFGVIQTDVVESVAISIASGSPTGATLSGTLTVGTVDGIATFNDLSINKSGIGFKLLAKVSTIGSVTSAAFDITPGAPAKLAFSGTFLASVAGLSLTSPPNVVVQDSQGNLVSTASNAITIAIDPSSTVVGATLSGTTTVNAANGLAVFNGLSIDKSGTGYKFSATADGLTPAISGSLTVNPSSPVKLGFIVTPADSLVLDPLAPDVKVAVQDAFGNTASVTPQTITLSIDNNPSGGTLSGIATANTGTGVNTGVATFTNMMINQIGVGYTLKATNVTYGTASSSPFNITYKLAFKTQPTTTVAGQPISSFEVQALDGNDNPITTLNSNVTISFSVNPGNTTLSGTLTRQMSGGVATFDDISIDIAANGYKLVATAPGVISSSASTAFNITAGTATGLTFVTSPVDTVAGAVITPNVRVAAIDQFGNTVTSPAVTISLGFGNNPGGGTITGGSKSTTSGIATFNTLSIDKAGQGYTLVASSGMLSTATSNPFNIMYKLRFVSSPATTTAGTTISSFQVAIANNGNTTQTGESGTITIAFQNNPGNATLLGTTTVNVLSGIATFSDLSIQKTGTSYSLSATSTGRQTATSSSFNITPASPSKLAFDIQPSDVIVAAAMAPAVKVKVLDQYDNHCTTATNSVSIALGANPTGATLTGGSATAAVAGVATFSTLAVDKAGDDFTLVASAPTLTDGTSNTFDAKYKLVFTTQPTNTGAGLNISPAVEVSVQDALGNTITSATPLVTVALGNNPPGATLGGTLSVTAQNGVAVFNNLNLNKTGLSFTLVATSPAIVSGTSSPFNNTYRLIFTDQPTASVTNSVISPSVRVTVKDGNNNTITTVSGSVTVAIGTNPGGGTISGTLSATLINGVATFNNLTINSAGSGYTLVATATGIAIGTSNPFDVRNRLIFTVSPSNTTSDSVITPDIQVSVQDGLGTAITSATDTITLAIASGTAGATLGGVLSVDAQNGVAVFSGLDIDKVGTYTLTASAAGLASATSGSFNITPGAAVKLAFVAQPTNIAAGVATGPVTVELLDVNDNRATQDTRAVAIALLTNPGNDTLAGTLSVNAVAGLATFSDLVLTKAANGYSLTASAAGLTSDSSNTYNVSTAAASKLVITSEPTNALAGASISPAISVTIKDAFNNTVNSSAPVAAAITTNPGSGTLSGTTSVNASAGVATFSNLSINKAGNGYVLQFTSNSLTGAFSQAFNISPNAPTKVVIRDHPTNAVTNAIITPDVVAAIEDAFGNTVDTYAGDISLAFGTNNTGATLLGNTTQAVSAGIATFSDLSVNRAGTGYTLVASSAALTPATSNSFNITNRLAFSVSPADTVAGLTITPAVKVAVVDANGNTMTSASDMITLQFENNPVSATLSGTLSAAAISGVATFSNLSIAKAASNFSLRATATGVQSTVSSDFDILPAAADHIAFSVQPVNGIAGTALNPAVTVSVFDGLNNLVTNASPVVDLALSLNPGNATLGGTVSKTITNGVAVFNDLRVDVVATGYRLTATCGALAAVNSNTFNIAHGTASKLAFGAQPQNTIAGVTLAPAVFVVVQDAFGNTVTSASNTVSLSVSGGATLGGTLSAAASSGVATFSNLIMTKAGSGYVLTATATSLTSGTSSAFDVLAATPTQIAFTVQPSNAEPGVAITPAVTVAVQDAYGNAATSATGAVMLTLITSGNATLGGSTSVIPTNGVASFSDLNVVGAGYGLTLQAAYGALTPKTSNSFNVVATTPPQITSNVTPSATYMNAGQVITFTIGATDNQALSYTWDFGDTTATVTTTNSVQHTYATAGTYLVTVTVTNTSGLSTTTTLSITMGAVISPDDICFGLNTVGLTVQKFGAKLSFSKPLKDSIALTAAIDLKDGFNPIGQEVRWNIAGVAGSVTMDAKGKSPSSTSVKVSFKYKKPAKGEAFTARPGVVQIAVKNQTLSGLILKGIAKLNTTTATTGETSRFDTCIVLTNHQAYRSVDTTGIYKAKEGKTGSFKF